MDEHAYAGFLDEFRKLSARKDVTQLLSNLAAKRGVNPTKLPSIKQVGAQLEQGNRGRASEIASNVRSYLKAQPRAA